MKTFLLCSALFLGGLTLQAADYELTTAVTGNWDTRDWKLVPGPGSGVPGAGDSILDISGATFNINLNGNRTVANFGKTRGTSTRILNTNGQDDTLTITGNMNVESGTFSLRSATTGRLSVIVEGNLNLGTANPGDAANGGLTFGDTSAYRNVSFTVEGTTLFQGYAARLLLDSGATAADTRVHLGRVIFSLPTLSSGNPAIGLTASSGTLVSVSSIETTVNDTRGRIYGSSTGAAGRLRIDGESGAFVYHGSFFYHLAIEKVGGNLQVFSRANGNDYSGGTLVTKGVLAITNTNNSGLGTGAVEVSGEGILAGSGRIVLGAGNAVVVKAGGMIAPGEADRLMNPDAQSFRQLTLNGLNQTVDTPTILEMEEGASFLFRVNENGGSDSLNFVNYKTGGLLLAQEGIRIDISGQLAEGETYTLMRFSINSGLEGGLVMGSGFDGYQATFHYDEALYGGVGTIAMTVTAIPEPSTVGFLLISGLGAWCFQRRSRQVG